MFATGKRLALNASTTFTFRGFEHSYSSLDSEKNWFTFYGVSEGTPVKFVIFAYGDIGIGRLADQLAQQTGIYGEYPTPTAALVDILSKAEGTPLTVFASEAEYIDKNGDIQLTTNYSFVEPRTATPKATTTDCDYVA